MQSRVRGTVVGVGKGLLLSIAVLVCAAQGASAACPSADNTACPAISPAGCTANRMSIDIIVGSNSVPNNSVVTYEVDFQNNPANSADACDVNKATLTFCCPGADGNPVPGPSGCVHIPVSDTMACNVNDGPPNCTACTGPFAFSATAPGNPQTKVTGLQCLVNVTPGVLSATARAMVDSGYLLCQAAGGVVQPALPKDLVVQVLPPTFTPTNTPTNTPTATNTFTQTPTATPTSTQTFTFTPTLTASPTNTPTATNTFTQTPTFTPTLTPTNTATPSPTSPPIPVVPTPTSPAGLVLITGLGLSIAWMLRRAARTKA